MGSCTGSTGAGVTSGSTGSAVTDLVGGSTVADLFVTPVPPQYASAGRFYLVGAWLLALLDNTARFPSMGDRVACSDVFAM